MNVPAKWSGQIATVLLLMGLVMAAGSVMLVGMGLLLMAARWVWGLL